MHTAQGQTEWQRQTEEGSESKPDLWDGEKGKEGMACRDSKCLSRSTTVMLLRDRRS